MTLIEQLKKDSVEALKANESLRVEVLRGLLAAVHNREIELRGKGKELSEEEVLTVLGREAKKRKEANQIYSEAGRVELAEKESRELKIIKSYLPPEMGSDEIEVIVRKIVGDGVTEFGQVMGAVVKETKGRAEPGVVKGIVEKILDKKHQALGN